MGIVMAIRLILVMTGQCVSNS